MCKSEDFGKKWEVVNPGNKWMDESTFYNLVRVSKANHDIIWAGGAISSEQGFNIYYSTDEGSTYNEIGNIENECISEMPIRFAGFV